MIWEGIYVHTGYICRYGKRRKTISVGLVRILQRTASPYCELMQRFWERDAVSLHILIHDQMLIHPAELSGHHPVSGLNSLSSQCTLVFSIVIFPPPISCSSSQQSPRLMVPAVAIRTHSLWRSICVKQQPLAPQDQMTSPLWDGGTTKPEELIRSLWSYLTGLQQQVLKTDSCRECLEQKPAMKGLSCISYATKTFHSAFHMKCFWVINGWERYSYIPAVLHCRCEPWKTNYPRNLLNSSSKLL